MPPNVSLTFLNFASVVVEATGLRSSVPFEFWQEHGPVCTHTSGSLGVGVAGVLCLGHAYLFVNVITYMPDADVSPVASNLPFIDSSHSNFSS